MSDEINHHQYGEILRYIVAEIKSARVTLARRVNTAMMQMYWKWMRIELALRDFNKPIGVAEYRLQFPEKEIKELINREVKKFMAEKNIAKNQI